MSNQTTITLTNGIPTAPSGTVSSLDAIFNATNGPAAIKAASTAPVATDPAIVVALSPNGLLAPGGAIASQSSPVVNADQYGIHKEVAAGQTAALLGSTGALGDYLKKVTVFPGVVACGVVTIFDGAVAIGTFAGGGTTALPSTIPFDINVEAFCTSSAGWKITTGANVTVSATGKFT